MYYAKGEKPEKIQQYYLGTNNQNIVGGNLATGPLTKPKVVEPKSSLSFQPKRKPNILRTIYMPNYEVDQGTEQINKMRDLISEEKEYYEGLMKSMQEDKTGFEE